MHTFHPNSLIQDCGRHRTDDRTPAWTLLANLLEICFARSHGHRPGRLSRQDVSQEADLRNLVSGNRSSIEDIVDVRVVKEVEMDAEKDAGAVKAMRNNSFVEKDRF